MIKNNIQIIRVDNRRIIRIEIEMAHHILIK